MSHTSRRHRPHRDSGPAGLNLAPDGTVTRVDTDRDARALAQQLLSPEREWPVVAVSVHPDAPGPYIDPEELAGQLKDVAAVVLITSDATFGLTNAFGNRQLSVFYGAGRVYPPGTAWTHDMYQAPLHMCATRAQGRRKVDSITSDALSAAVSAGLMTQTPQRPGDEPVSVTVRSAMGPAHAQVRTDDGRTAVMLTAQLGSQLPAHALVRSGQRLTGRLRHGEGLWPAFLPDPPADDPAARVHEQFPDGAVTLAKTQSTADHEARLLLHPDVPVLVDTGDDEAGSLLSEGDVVAVEVVWEDGRPYGALLGDPSEVELAPSIGVLPGGPAWLTTSDAATPKPPPQTAPPEPADEPGEPGDEVVDLTDARRMLRNGRDAYELLTRQLNAVEAERDRMKAEVRGLKDKLRKATSKRNRSTFAPVWRDPERQLRHEIALAYLLRIPEEDRAARPLPERYAVGPEFLSSLAALQGISREKVLAVLVECLVGLDKELSGRQRHAWLEKQAGKQLSRPDGSLAWRVSLQANTPGARRLKYWTLPDGTIEFDSVGHHDAGLH